MTELKLAEASAIALRAIYLKAERRWDNLYPDDDAWNEMIAAKSEYLESLVQCYQVKPKRSFIHPALALEDDQFRAQIIGEP
jgi:hypothetical protein